MDTNPGNCSVLVQDAHVAAIQISAPDLIGVDAIIQTPGVGDAPVVRRDRGGFGTAVIGLPGCIGVLRDQAICLRLQVANGQVSGSSIEIGEVSPI